MLSTWLYSPIQPHLKIPCQFQKWSVTAIKRLHYTDSYHFSFPSTVCQPATPAVSQASNDSENSRPESWHTRTEQHCWYSLCVIHPLCSPWSSHQTAVWEWPRTRDEKGKKERKRKYELERIYSQISIEMIWFDAMMLSEIMWWQEARSSHEGHSQCLYYAAASLNTLFFCLVIMLLQILFLITSALTSESEYS